MLAARPQVVLLLDTLPASAADFWRRAGISDVRLLPTDVLSRPGPRLAQGIAAMCRVLRRPRAP